MAQSSRPVTIRAAEAVLDFTIYPRNHVDETNVRMLRDARDAGEELPPIVIDQDSLRVIDGFHRVTEVLRRDSEATILAVKVDYPGGVSEMFLDAVRRNARHGVRLSAYDHARCLTLADDLSISVVEIAGALSISVDVTAQIKARRIATGPGGAKVNVKRSLRHLAGSKLTEAQVDANERSSGWPARFHAEQLTMLISSGSADLTDESTLEALRRCIEVVSGAIGTVAV